jgi:hypothetical protein
MDEFDERPEQGDAFEQELREAFERRPAPPKLKQRVLDEAARRRQAGLRSQVIWWQRIAAGVVLAAIVGGGVVWREARQAEQQREGEMARQQVMAALRITGHALNRVNSRLTARDRGE